MGVLLYDQLGRPLAMREAAKPSTEQIRVSGIRDRWGTYPADGLTPERLARILKQADQGDVAAQAEMFGQMEEKDGHLASQFGIRKLAVQGLPIEVIAADDSPKAKEIATAAEEMLHGLEDFDETILELLDALGNGYSLVEIGWDNSEGQSSITRLEHHEARFVSFVNSLEPRLITEGNWQGQEIPPFRCIYHRYKARCAPAYRAGIMRTCAWMYLFKNFDIKSWVAFAEVYGMPIRLGKYPSGATLEDQDKLLAAVRAIGSDAAGIIPKEAEIEFVESAKTSSQDIYKNLADWCDVQISRAVLGQTLTSSDGGGSGSYALGQVHADVRQDLVEADAKALSKTISRQLVRPWVGFNYGWDAPMPQFVLKWEPPEDLLAQARLDKLLQEMGYPLTLEEAQERYKRRAIGKGETVLVPLSRAAPAAQPGEDTAQLQAAKAELPDADEPHPVDAIVRQDGPDLGPWIGRVRQLLAEVADLGEFGERLIGLWAELPEAEVAELMAQAMTVAELAGRYDGTR